MKNKILLLTAVLLTITVFGCANRGGSDGEGPTIINYNLNQNTNTLHFDYEDVRYNVDFDQEIAIEGDDTRTLYLAAEDAPVALPVPPEGTPAPPEGTPAPPGDTPPPAEAASPTDDPEEAKFYVLVEHHDTEDDNDRVFTLHTVTEDAYNALQGILSDEEDTNVAGAELAEAVLDSDAVARLEPTPPASDDDGDDDDQ